MLQSFYSGTASPLNNTTVKYIKPVQTPRNWSWQNSSSKAKFIAPADCTIKNFFVKLSEEITQGSYSFVLVVNGAVSQHTIIIGKGGSYGLTEVPVELTKGDLVHLEVTPTDSPNVVEAYWGIEIETPGNIGIYPGNPFDAIYNGAVRYYGALYSAPAMDDVTKAANLMPGAGTIKKFIVRIDQVVESKRWYFSIFKNGVEELTSKITFANNDETKEVDLNISFAKGDLLAIKVEPSPDIPPNNTFAQWSVAIEHETSTESFVVGNSYVNLPNDGVTTKYARFQAGDSNYGSNTKASFAIAINGLRHTELKNFVGWLSAAPTINGKYKLTVLKNELPTDFAVEFWNTETYKETTSDPVTLKTGESFEIAVSSTCAPQSAYAKWGAIQTVKTEKI